MQRECVIMKCQQSIRCITTSSLLVELLQECHMTSVRQRLGSGGVMHARPGKQRVGRETHLSALSELITAEWFFEAVTSAQCQPEPVFSGRSEAMFHPRAGNVLGHDVRTGLGGYLGVFVSEQAWSAASERVGVCRECKLVRRLALHYSKAASCPPLS